MADILVLHFTEENRLPSLNEKEREDIKLGIEEKQARAFIEKYLTK